LCASALHIKVAEYFVYGRYKFDYHATMQKSVLTNPSKYFQKRAFFHAFVVVQSIEDKMSLHERIKKEQFCKIGQELIL